MADNLWKECINWLIRCQVLPPDHLVAGRDVQLIDFVNTLRDGVLLCQLLNRLVEGCLDLKEISLRPQMSQFLSFKNIRSFLHTCQNVFELEEADLFEPANLFDNTDFEKVLHTLSVLSKSPKAEQTGVKGFPIHVIPHDYYNDDIYRNLDLANHNEDPMVPINLPTSRRTKEEDIYEDLCYVTLRVDDAPTVAHAPLEKKDYCIKELVETEKNYIDALNMIIKHFMIPLEPLINPERKNGENEKLIFKNIKELAEIHTGFHSELYKACTSSHHKISDCFLHWKEKFIIYGDYCSNLPRAQDAIDELCKNEAFNQALTQCQVEANDGRFKLRDLLSVPMQRILKYHLLLKELLKNTPKNHDDYNGLEKALDAMKDLAQYINEVKRDTETLQIIEDIQANITELTMPQDTSLKDYGRLVKDGDLKLKSHQDNKIKNRYVFVFDKVMLMCKSTKMMDKLLGSEQYSFKDALIMNEYHIDTTIPKGNNRDKWVHHWYFVHNNKVNTYTMYTKTEESKNKWINAIQKALDNVNPPEAQNSDHNFEMFTFKQPTHCADCNKLLRGIYFQGYKCTVCNLAVHKSCLATVHACGAPSLAPRPSPTQVDNTVIRVTARVAFRALQPGQLSFDENDIIYVLRKANSQWWEGYVKRTKEKGIFPVECVEPFRGITYESPFHNQRGSLSPLAQQSDSFSDFKLEEHDWFVGIMDRHEATCKLMHLSSGTFLVRISPKLNGDYAISMVHNKQIRHMKINLSEDRKYFYLSKAKYFKSITDLVRWYMENLLAEAFRGLNTTLSIPYKKSLLMTHRSFSNSSLNTVGSQGSKDESEEAASPVGCNPISPPMGFATVLFDFECNAPNVLSLKKGERIAILSKSEKDKGWWKGRVNNQDGYFLASNVSENEETSN